MTRKKTILLFIPVILALALLLGVNWTIRPAQASGPLGKTASALPGSLAQVPRLERVTVQAEGDKVNAPEAACTYQGTPGLVVYFPLDESAGATSFVSDVSGLTLTGTCTGAACPVQTPGRAKGAFSFDGGDEITVPYNPVTDWSQTQDFSLEAWVNFTSTCGTREVFLGRYRGGDESNLTSWWLGCEAGTNQAAFNLRSSAWISPTFQPDSMTIIGGPALNDGQWHHVVAVHDAISTTLVVTDTNYLYVDGVEVAKGDHNYLDDFVTDTPLDIGWYNAGDLYHYNGILDEVAIYDQVLAPAKIAEHYNCNDAPIAVDDALATSKNTPLVIQVATLKANDSDPNGDTFTLSAGGSTSQGGTVTGSGPWTYTPKNNFVGTDTFVYTATDSHGATDTATVTVTINAVNEPPVAVDDALVTDEDTPLVIQVNDLKANDSDPNGDAFTLTAGGSTSQGGTVTPTGNGPWTYTPKLNFNGTDTFTYTATDTLTATDTATVTVTVNPVNDAPLVTNPGGKTNQVGDTVNVQTVASDVDGDDLTYSATGLPDGLGINFTTGLISGTVATTAKGSYTAKITVTDGKNPVTVEFTWVIGVPKVYLPLLLRNASQGG